jgi:hypothetical protein
VPSQDFEKDPRGRPRPVVEGQHHFMHRIHRQGSLLPKRHLDSNTYRHLGG